MRLKDVVAQEMGLNHHPRNVERTFEEIAFGGLRHRSVAMQIAIPLAVFRVGEVGVGPLAD